MKFLILIAFVTIMCFTLNAQEFTSKQGGDKPAFCDMHMHLSLKKYYQNLSYDSRLNWTGYDDNRKKLH